MIDKLDLNENLDEKSRERYRIALVRLEISLKQEDLILEENLVRL